MTIFWKLGEKLNNSQHTLRSLGYRNWKILYIEEYFCTRVVDPVDSLFQASSTVNFHSGGQLDPSKKNVYEAVDSVSKIEV